MGLAPGDVQRRERKGQAAADAASSHLRPPTPLPPPNTIYGISALLLSASFPPLPAAQRRPPPVLPPKVWVQVIDCARTGGPLVVWAVQSTCVPDGGVLPARRGSGARREKRKSQILTRLHAIRSARRDHRSPSAAPADDSDDILPAERLSARKCGR